MKKSTVILSATFLVIVVLVMYLLTPSPTPLWLVAAQAALFLIYGARLSGFLLVREFRSASFKKTNVAKDSLAKNNEKKMPFFVLFTIWIFVAALYVAQVSPMLFRFKNESTDILLPAVGMGISVLGLIIESVADRQKSAQKKIRPDMVATKGLYRIVRCPNYFGEILTWTGVFVGGLTALSGAWEWVVACVCYVTIVFIMINGAQRLEKRQDGRYGKMQEYKDYISRTPIIFPFVPIYSLVKKK